MIQTITKNHMEPRKIRGAIRERDFFFHDKILGLGELWEGQREIFKALRYHNRITIKAGYNVGKTYCLAAIGLRFLYSHPHSILITTAPTERQVKKLLWGEIRKKFKGARVSLGGRLGIMSLQIKDDWYALGFSTDNVFRVAGFHAPRVMVLVDEASGMKDEIIDQLDGIVSGSNSYMIYAGNPLMASGRFYDSFKDSKFHKITLSSLDHPNVKTGRDIYPGMVTKEWVEDKKRKWGENSPLFHAKVLGNFPENMSDYVIQLTWAELAKHSELDAGKAIVEAGLDISEFGGDETVYIARQGPKVLGLHAWSHTDLMETCGRAIDLNRRYGVKLLKGDRIGIGAGVMSRLAESSGISIQAVSVAEKAIDLEQYEIVRDEIWYNLADRFKDGNIDCTLLDPNDELFGQLTSVKKFHTSKGLRKIESKDSMKKRGLPSPDRADALCLAFHKPEIAAGPRITLF